MKLEPYTVPHDQEHAGLRDYRPGFGTAGEVRSARLLILGCVLVISFLLGFMSGTVYGAEAKRVTLQVRPRFMLPMTRNDVRVEMRVPRHADNRLLVLSWDAGAAGAGSAHRQLEGDDSPVLFTDWLKSLPAAPYLFVATVYDSRGKVLGQDTAEILTSEEGR